MNFDLDAVLNDWPYDPNSVNARWIVARDGSRKLQLRLDLGILQMEPTGRPDGQRPYGFETLLDYYASREQVEGTDVQGFSLDPSACAELQQEAAQFYYRYISLYALRDLDGVVADTEHALGILELVARHVEDGELVWQFIQFYPYIRMMHARALAERAAEKRDYDAAIRDLEEGIEDIREFWRENGSEDDIAESREIELLTDLLSDMRGSRPRSEIDRLQDELMRAIAAENYEKAARLRDALKLLRNS
ncbi:MAG: UvrB/UvrC motif-containing protein [Kiritimatiellae bacterium]|nr:UvrB/UvrC motif-containing protein [Kiritimatiellia bacterium]MDW8457684.1 UvrB/UvrC motif-containing protein [Verrucomicrobiota bacterium]